MQPTVKEVIRTVKVKDSVAVEVLLQCDSDINVMVNRLQAEDSKNMRYRLTIDSLLHDARPGD